MNGGGGSSGPAVTPPAGAEVPVEALEFAAAYLAQEGLSLGAAPMAARANLADMPPGPGLAAVLDGLDARRLNGAQLSDVIRAYQRLVAHLQAG